MRKEDLKLLEPDFFIIFSQNSLSIKPIILM